ncbi:MAG TPA: hypothetical protein VMB80_08350 [Candidatus Acidoferrum sp.]|nr:hypothetical protein [Candidatus Acidoferrum sp.]
MSDRLNIFALGLRIISLGLALGSMAALGAENEVCAGPLYEKFVLTLGSGHRTEAVGPFFYDQSRDSETTWAIPPLLSYDTDPDTESKEFDLLYPLLTYERFGMEYRGQFLELFSFAGGQNQNAQQAKRVTLFPIYFQQRSPDTNRNYTALIPIYGHIKDRLFRDDIFVFLFPLYSETRKRDVVTDNYLFPIFHLRHGDGLRGWQCWPLVGNEHKDVTRSTNGFGETEVIGGHDRFFALWPVYFRQNNGLGTDNPEKFRATLLFYSLTRSPQRDVTTVIWPLFTWIDDRAKKYHEWEGPWPIIDIARGEGKTTTRFWPLFSRAHNDSFDSEYYLWPLYKHDRRHAETLDRERTRVLFYLFQDVKEKNLETGAERKRLDLWPLFVWHREFNGNRRLQILALVETALPDNRGVERNWSPLWSVWRSESNPKIGAASQSLLWNLYRRDTTAVSKKCSLLFGLFQYQSGPEMKQTRLFFIPVYQKRGSAAAPPG